MLRIALQLALALLVWRYYRYGVYRRDEKYSTFAPRFWTGAVDACVIWSVNFLTLLSVAWLPSRVAVLVATIVANGIWLAYVIVMHAKWGQTVGKMVCHVKVVDHVTEKPITWRQAMVREGVPAFINFGFFGYLAWRMLRAQPVSSETFGLAVLGWVSLPVLWHLAEVLTMLTNARRRALHDLLAGTVVVRTNVADTDPVFHLPAGTV